MKKFMMLVVSMYFATQVASAQPGQLDQSFGDHGIVKSLLGLPILDVTNFLGNDAVLIPGGGMYLVLEAPGKTYISKRFADGSVDPGYGNKGFAETDLSGTIAFLQTDGKIVATGNAPGGAYSVYRYTTAGVPDSSFAGTGKLTSHEPLIGIQPDGKMVIMGGSLLAYYDTNGSLISSFTIQPTGVESGPSALQSDGKIIIAGTVDSNGHVAMALARVSREGIMDSTFGVNGRVVTFFDSSDSYGNVVTEQADGKIIVAGHSYTCVQGVGCSLAVFVVARYNIDGSLDATFGEGGKLKTAFDGHYAVANRIAIGADKKIVVVGRVDGLGIARYNTNGTLDSTFDGDGKLMADEFYNDDHSSVVVQSDEKIVVTGWKDILQVFRFNVNGSPDNSFGNDGILSDNFTINHGKTTSLGFISAQSDGKLVAVGSAWDGETNAAFPARYEKNGDFDSTYNQGYNPAGGVRPAATNSIVIQHDDKLVLAGTGLFNSVIARFNTNGDPDSSFSGDGVQQSGDISSMAVQPGDGKIVGGGSVNHDFGFFRYKTNGDPDSTFGVNGQADLRFSLPEDNFEEHIKAIALQNDGKIIAGGYLSNILYFIRVNTDGSIDEDFNSIYHGDDILHSSYPLVGFPPPKSILVQSDGKVVALLDAPGVFELLRFNSDGTFDSTFNRNGIVTTTFDSLATATALAIQPDGKFIVGGYVKADSLNSDFALARYNTNGTPDSSFGVNGKQMTDAGGSEMISGITIANNRLYVAGTGVYPSGSVGIVASYLLDNQQQQQTVSCPASKIVSTAKGRCDTVVNDIDPVVSNKDVQIKYTMSGATTGTGTGSLSGKVFNKGITNVTYALAADTSKNCSFTITVNDKEAPEISPIFAFPNILWPANNTMRNVYLFYNNKDNCGSTNCKISVTSSQDIMGDWQVINDHLIKLRAQHSGRRTRIYTVTVTCTDASGNKAHREVRIWVPGAFGGRDLYVDKEDNSGSPFEKIIGGFGVRAYPNPASDQFNLQLISDNNHDKINLRIYDMSGRIMEVKTGLVPGENIQVGSSLKTGTYMAEVWQGMNIQRIKLIKIR